MLERNNLLLMGLFGFFSVACRTLGALLMFGRLQSSSPLYRYVSLCKALQDGDFAVVYQDSKFSVIHKV